MGGRDGDEEVSMKNILVEDKTIGSYCRLIYDCTEDEFLNWVNRRDSTDYKPNEALGKTIIFEGKDRRSVYLWVKDKNNLETLSHETLHLIRYWLQDFQSINLNAETEEIYTCLMSFYLKKFMRLLGLKKFTSTPK